MFRWISIALLFAAVMRAQTAVPGTSAEQKEDEEHAAMHAGGIQSGIDSAQKDADDADEAIAPLLKKLTRVQKVAFDRAAAAMQHFIDVQVTGDYLFMGGYGSGGLYPNEEHAAFENFVINVLQQTPAIPSPAEYKAADDALNKVYGQLMKAAGPIGSLPRNSQPSYAIATDGLRAEQRAWLAYRDAFADFGRTLRPALPAATWLLPVTKSRANDLQTFYDRNAASYAEAVQRYNGWRARAVASQDARAYSERQDVADVLDHLTPPQKAAFEHVQSALDAYAAAHAASLPHPSPTFRSQQLQALYSELYSIQYNKTHGQLPDANKAAAGFERNDADLNAEYKSDLASTCLFQPVPGDSPSEHRTPEALRNEQRAWIGLRDAWIGFLETIYPDQSPAALSNMISGRRAFELRMLHRICERTGQPPREQ